MGNNLFIAGIGTDVGKTIVSAILTEALQADYWKPIQAGNIESSDSTVVKNLINNSVTEIHPPSYSLSIPASPHFSAEKEGVTIQLKNIQIPFTKNKLIIEGAGGIMVPLDRKELVIDLMNQLKAPIILVVRNYLGAINHTLLSIDALKQRNLNIKGIIYNGGNRLENIDFIENYSSIPTLGIIPELEVINKERISIEAAKFVGLSI